MMCSIVVCLTAKPANGLDSIRFLLCGAVGAFSCRCTGNASFVLSSQACSPGFSEFVQFRVHKFGVHEDDPDANDVWRLATRLHQLRDSGKTGSFQALV